MEWLSRFFDLLTHNEYFRAGFIWGLVVVAIGWAVWGLLYRLHVQWLKMRQFFEPTRVPGKVPVATGPSPASIMLGCLGRLLITLVVLATMVGIVLWLANPPGG